MELKLKQRKTSSNKQKVLFCIVALVLLFAGIGYCYQSRLSMDLLMNYGLTTEESINKVEVQILGQNMTAYVEGLTSPFVSSETGLDFKNISSDTNGKGLYITQGEERYRTDNTDLPEEEKTYPLYYFRGDVDNNNVLFANKCWKIVRTTETGGTKLIYNGIPDSTNEQGICANTGEKSQLESTSSFNERNQSPAYVGYMRGVNATTSDHDYEYKTFTTSSDVKYGSDVKWDGTVYTLTSVMGEHDRYHHYTCMNAEVSCKQVAFVYYVSGSTAYYLLLSNGENIEAAKDSMFDNWYDSSIKEMIDAWFSGSEGLINYSDYLDDTIWCNEKSIYSTTGISEYDNMGITYFSPYTGVYGKGKPDLMCYYSNNRLMLRPSSNSNINLKGSSVLYYPVGLITLDEARLAGLGTETSTSYLNSGSDYWTLSPAYFSNSTAYNFIVDSNGKLSPADVSNKHGVRPAISLKAGTEAMSGTGTVDDPYVVTEYTPKVTLTYMDGTEQYGEQEKYELGQSVVVKDITNTHQNYNFRGWSVSPTADKVDYKVGDSMIITNNTNLYAVWEEVKIIWEDGFTDTPLQVYIYNESSIGSNNPESPTYEGYDFIYWSEPILEKDGNYHIYARWQGLWEIQLQFVGLKGLAEIPQNFILYYKVTGGDNRTITTSLYFPDIETNCEINSEKNIIVRWKVPIFYDTKANDIEITGNYDISGYTHTVEVSGGAVDGNKIYFSIDKISPDTTKNITIAYT